MIVTVWARAQDHRGVWSASWRRPPYTVITVQDHRGVWSASWGRPPYTVIMVQDHRGVWSASWRRPAYTVITVDRGRAPIHGGRRSVGQDRVELALGIDEYLHRLAALLVRA